MSRAPGAVEGGVRDVRLQPLARAKVASLGPAGARWEAALPDTLAALADTWGLTLGRALPGGSASYVVGARTRDGAERVVKVALPDPALLPGVAAEAAVLRAAGGQGYARLHAYDEQRHALLMESCGRSLERSALPVEEQLVVLADTLRLAWAVDVPTVVAPPRGEDRASYLHGFVLDHARRLEDHDLGPRFDAVLEQALEYAERRAEAYDPGACVVAHGDAHPANLLRAVDDGRARAAGSGTGWVFVDPDGVAADPAYDLGVALREWSGELTGPGARARAGGWATLLAERAGQDRRAVWEWGYVERVSTGLYVLGFGAERLGRRFLDSAALLLD